MIAKTIVLSAVLLRAAYTDIRLGKIENSVILIAALCGIAINYYNGGMKAVIQGMAVSAAMTAVLFLFFIIRGLGAGDVKLLALISLYLPEQGFRIMGASFVLAGVWSCFRMLVRVCRRKKAYIRGETLHFAVPVALGTMLVMGIERLF